MSKSAVERSAAYGAIAVGAVLTVFLIWFILFLVRPNGEGIDTTEAILAWISVGLLIGAVVATHIVYAWVLFAMEKGREFGI